MWWLAVVWLGAVSAQLGGGGGAGGAGGSPFDALAALLTGAPRDPREGPIPDHDPTDEFDFVVVGAGSAGCVLANRLSEIPSWRVLLLEAGGDENFLSDVPMLAALASHTAMNWDYSAEREPRACRDLRGGVCAMPRGRVLGGSSVLNFLIYTRGHPQDYDDWAAAGNDGWSYEDVLPYFRKSENVGVAGLRNSSYRGRDGYLDIQHSPFHTPLQTAFKKAGQELGYAWNDPNGERLIGFSKPQATMRNGRRCSTSKAFLEPVRDRPNLHVSKYSTVTKVLIEPMTKRAYGVEFIKKRRRRRVRATREVILAAGTIGSAQLLMLSGVGPAQHLRQLGIQPLLDLPVGDNLQDHVTFSGNAFHVGDPALCVNDIRAASPAAAAAYVSGRGPLTMPGGATGLAFFRTPYASRDHSDTRPDMELVMGAGSLAGDTLGVLRGLLGVTDRWFLQMYGGMSLMERQATFSLNPVLVRPSSVGSLRLRSASYKDKPLIRPNYFGDLEDLYALREGAKMVERVVATSAFRRYNTTLYNKPFPGCEHLEFRSDAYWECAIVRTSITLDHQVGTCKMGPATDDGAVVSPRLAVRGARGLRVADGSIVPRIPAAHTHAPIVMIAEKAADIIKQDWGQPVHVNS